MKYTAATTATRTLASRPGRTIRWLAWGFGACALVQVVFGLVLSVLNHLSLERFFAEYIIAQDLASIAFAVVGILIVRQHPTNTIGWLFCTEGVGFSLTAWHEQYVRYALVTRPGGLPINDLFTWIYFWSWLPVITLSLLFLPLLFPDGRLPSPRWRPLLWSAILVTVLLSASLALSPGPVDETLSEVANPFGLSATSLTLQVINVLIFVLMPVSLASAVVVPVVRFRRAQGNERQQLKWFAYATSVLIVAYVLGVVLFLSGIDTNPLLSGILLAGALPFLPIAVGIAILRHHLYDIDLIINRTLVYGALTASVIGIYILVVGYLGILFRNGFGSQGNVWLQLIATGVVAVLFAPLREWLQRAVNRLLFGQRDEPYTVLAQLDRRLEAAMGPEEVLPTVVATVKDALKLPYVGIMLKRDNAFVIAAVDGSPVGDPLQLPLLYQGAVVGQLLVSPRTPGELWSRGERHLLEDLTHHAGVAVHGVQVMIELQRARERLVLAREEERRRLRRDLHDDLAPALAALALSAAAIGELISTNPQTALAAVAKLRTSIRATVADVRRLAYDLRPPTLDELGLIEAIREHAAHYNAAQSADDGASSCAVTLEVPAQLPPLPAAVEVAVYRIVQEALMNVARHADAQTCVIRLDCANGRALEVEVADDGVGLPSERRSGVGLRSMQERASELGGSCVIARTGARGTRVAAWFPLISEHEPGEEGRAWTNSVS